MNRWQAQLDLEFCCDKEGKSILKKNQHTGPMLVQKPFYPEKACHVYLLHPPGGVAGCDDLHLKVFVNENCKVLLTTPGATKFYKSEVESSHVIQEFTVANNASVEFLPMQNIYYKGTSTRVDTIIKLYGNASFAFRDMTSCGFAFEDKPFENSSFFNRIFIYQDDKLKFLETNRVNGTESLENFLCNNSNVFIGTFLTVNVKDETLQNICNYLEENSIEGAAGITDSILAVRMLGQDNQVIEQALNWIWQYTRQETISIPPFIPRIWST
ncbi:MAG: urease accessory protein UreD [Succinatimonas hippei]|nr:urease accessory protein UreD [Succinatimonas hippei]